MKKRTKIILIVIAVIVLATYFFKLFFSWFQSYKEKPSDSMSDQAISMAVSQMVESEVARQMSESTTSTQVTEPAITLPTSATKATQNFFEVSENSDTVTKGTEMPSSLATEIYGIVTHNGTDYNLPVVDDLYEATFKSVYLPSGRDLSISINLSNVTNVEVSLSFAESDREMSDFSEFSKIDFSTENSGIVFSYSIPDHPDGHPYNFNINLYAVYRIETADSVYYTSISY